MRQRELQVLGAGHRLFVYQKNVSNDGQFIKHKCTHYTTLSKAPLGQIIFLINWGNSSPIIKMNIKKWQQEGESAHQRGVQSPGPPLQLFSNFHLEPIVQQLIENTDD